MTYIDRINSFWDYAATNPLSTGQVSLYLALLHVCNRSYWTEWFPAQSQVLSILTGLSRSGILKARNELKQRGLIDFKERGTKATLYQFILANSTQESTQNSKQNSAQAIYSIYNNIQKKDKDHRQKDKDHRQPPLSPIVHFAAFWSAYPNKKRQALTEQAYCALLLSGTVSEEALVKSAQNYAEYVQITGEKMYLPNNFLEKAIFEDFLPGVYQKPNSEKGKRGASPAAVEQPDAFRMTGAGMAEPEEDEEVLSEEELAGEDWMQYGPGWRERHV